MGEHLPDVVSWWNDLSDRSSAAERLELDQQSQAFFKGHRCAAVTRLSGGYVNFVCRAFLETSSPDPDDGGAPQDAAASLTLAPPSVIVKRFSSSEHNSTSYEVERTALWLCNAATLPPPPAADPQRHNVISIRVPRLLAFDDASRTIVMEDAGANTKMLSEWLSLVAAPSADDSTPPSPAEAEVADVAAGWPALTAGALVEGFAAFFGTLRTAASAAGLLSAPGVIGSLTAPPAFDLQLRGQASDTERSQWYAHYAAQALAFGVPPPIVEALAPSAQDPNTADAPDAPAVSGADAPTIAGDSSSRWRRRADAVHDGWDWSVAVASSGDAEGSSRFSPADLSLIVGDLWPNSVLIDAAKRSVWIVDWEAAEVGRAGRDVALLIDHLWVMTQNPSKYDKARAQKLIHAFEQVFSPAPTPGAAAAHESADWRLGREPEFLRSVAMFAGSPHYGLDHALALRRALDEIAALSEQ